MTTGKTEETEETCGNQTTEETSSRAGNLEPCGSFTALSTIAIQAGQSQIVASVLKSGCLIHLQLVQFQPGLCEIGSNQEENSILIQEHQQLLQKLQKHEPEVLAVVEKKQQDTVRMMRDGRRKQKEEEVNEAMKASLSEGWSLLLRLLGRRLEVLKMASDFFLLVMEFSISIDRLEDLQIKADEDKLTEVQVTYDFTRKDLLGKSLQVLTSSSVLLQRLRQLQRTEALQRRGRVLQDEEAVEESSQGSQFSRGPVLMLEELVEALQDRRRRVDQAFRLQLQQAEVVLKMKAESKRASTEHQLLSALQDQNVLNLNLQSGSTSDHTVDPGSEGSSEPNMLRPACTLDLQSKSWSEQRPINQPEGMEDVNLEHGSRLQESGKEPDVKPDFWLDLNSQSRDLKSGSKSDEIKDVQADLKHGSRSDPLSKSRSTEARNHGLGSRSDLKLIPASEKTKNLMANFRSGETTETRSEAEVVSLKSALQGQSRSGSEKARNLLPESSLDESTDLQTGLWLDLKTEPATKDSESNFRSGPKNQSRSELLRSGSKEGKDVRPAFRSDETSKQQLESRSVETRDSLPGSRPVLTTRSRSHEQHTSGCDVKPGSTLDDTRTQQSGSRSVDTRIQHTGSRPEGIRNLKLSCRSENITETISEKTRNQQPESGSAGITDLHTRSRLDLKNQSSSDVPRSGSQEGKKLGTLHGAEKTRKQNKKSKTADTNDSNFSFSSVLKSRSRSEEQQRCGSDAKPRSELELTKTQQSGSRSEVSGSGSDLLSIKHQLDETKLGLNEQQTHHQMEAQQQQEHEMFSIGYQERLMKTLQDLNCVSELLVSCTQLDLGSELQTSRLLERFKEAEPHFRQLDAEVEYTVKSWESLREVHACLEEVKTGAVMNEDLLELLKIQQTVKDKIQRSELILNLSSSFHLTAKQLELLLQSEPTSPVTGSTGLHGSREAELGQLQEAEQQIQNLLKTTSTMRTDICAAVSQSNWAGFQVEQLEVRLGSLDSLCESWLNKAAQCEEELRREQLTHLLHEDITQLHESFKDLKKRFSNTKFNYLKRNDRTRNLKGVWNQLQQMEVYQEKLQGLRKRIHRVMAQQGSEVKNTCVARQVEDAVNELQRQMGQLERNICEHQKTLDMTCRLQQAMDEYQLWCEEASATIARVGKFSLECRSTEAVSVLYRQFEKFVWPTVPQQEERISQITELAVRLHGVEEGQRYIEKMVSKHSEMVKSIRELSNGLMELEAKLKVNKLYLKVPEDLTTHTQRRPDGLLESLKQQQFDEDKEVEEEGEREHRRHTEEQEKIKEKRRMKQKKQRDNRSTQEAVDMHELKETGHTPELITEKDRKEAAATNREPPLEKTQSHGVNGPKASRELQSGKFTSSFTSTHTLTICSPVDVKRQVQAAPNQSQTVATEPQATPSQSIIGPSLPDNQEEFHSEMEGTELQMDSSFCRSNTNLLKETSPHVELHQPEVMTEDFLSNDEYDCASPDDISLPPLAETPESNMFLSDVEEGFCFSSHSVHISQASHQFHAQSEPNGTGPLPQQKESGQTESCPPSTVSLHSSTRFRSESRSFMPSPSTVPVATPFTSTLSTILKTKDSSTVLSLDNSVHGYNTIDCSKDRNGLKKRSPSKTPTQDVSQSLRPQSFNGSDTVLHNYNSPKGDTGVRTFRPSYTRTDCILPEKRDLLDSYHGTRSHTLQDVKSVTNSRETTPQRDSLTKASTSLISQQSTHIQSSFSGNHCTIQKVCSDSAQEGTINSYSDPVPKSEQFFQSSSVADSVLHKDLSLLQDDDFLEISTTIPQSSATPQDPDPSRNSTNTRSKQDQDVPSPLRDSSLWATTTITQQSIFNQSFSSGRSQTDTTSNKDVRDPPVNLTHSPPQPTSINNIGICCSKQSLQTVYPLQEFLIFNHTQQFVHGPSMSPSLAQPAPPHPDPQTHASPHPANLHGTSPYSPPHVLTPTQDPDICLPMAIREEIRLTPQIQGPHLLQLSSESLPLEKASEPGLPCFTRPLSQAIIMEGSPVTLEVEVMGKPEPRLTRGSSCRVTHEGVSPCYMDQNRDQEQTCSLQDSQRLAGSSSSVGDNWLVLEAFDIIMEDWSTWFGTLCVLLWLLWLILL